MLYNTMDVLEIKLICTCVIFFFGGNYCEECNNDLSGKSDAVRLSNDLLCNYNRNIIPVLNQSTQINVSTYIYIFNIHMNEQWNILQLNAHIIMLWKDEFLVWDSSKYDNIDEVFQDSATIWTPGIMSYNTGFYGDDESFNNFLPRSMVLISNNGLVKYTHRINFNSHCSANLMKWPYDSHNCTFYIGSSFFGNGLVNYIFPDELNNGMSYYKYNREWIIRNINYSFNNVEFNTERCILQCNIDIERFSSLYSSSVIIPIIVISWMRTFTFLLGYRTSLRLILLCLFFISELLYIQFLDMKIPNNGEHPVYIVLLLRNSLILTAVAIIINVISNEFYKRGTDDFPSDGPKWLKSISIFLLNKIPTVMITSFNTQGVEFLVERNAEDTLNSQRDEKALFWKQLSIMLDRLFFIIIFVISLIFFIFLMP